MNIGLGQYPEAVYASRAISGNGQYMPDSSTVLTKSGGATSDAWGAAMLASLSASEGFMVSPLQDVAVQFIGNTGTGNIEEYDQVAGAWVNKVSITDALVHVIRAPLGPFRIGCATATGTTAVKLRTMRQNGTP